MSSGLDAIKTRSLMMNTPTSDNGVLSAQDVLSGNSPAMDLPRLRTIPARLIPSQALLLRHRPTAGTSEKTLADV